MSFTTALIVVIAINATLTAVRFMVLENRVRRLEDILKTLKPSDLE